MMKIQEIIIKNCKKHLGTPYVWGGESLDEGGFDCSGFVHVVLNESDIKVGRATAQGLYNKYKKNTCDKDVPCALLFFGSGKTKITHVAISAGDGKMYESIGGSKNTKSNPGKGVSLSKISRRKDFVFAATPFVFAASIIPKLASCSPVLKIGSKGVEVNYLQQDLNYVGAKPALETDGDFGPLTDAALRKFQNDHNLVNDGKYGKHSHDVMKECLK